MTSKLISTLVALCVVSGAAAALARTMPAESRVAPAPALAATLAPAAGTDTAVFAGGCFWGIEAVFDHVKGVVSATSGYAGGTVAKPSYEDVSSGTTGHAESVRVVFDPSQVSYGQLLQVFFSSHDPTQLNHQDPDVGTQYRSAVFYRTPAQKAAAEAYVKQLDAAHTFPKPVVTQVAPLGTSFYAAEGYHQHYLEQHPDQPYIRMYDAPKLVALKQHFPALYK